MNPDEILSQVTSSSATDAAAALLERAEKTSAAAASASAATPAGLLGGLTFGGIMVMLVLSLVGLAYFRYGKVQGEPLTIITGVALMVFPYFVGGTFNMIGVGLGIIALHRFLRSR